MDALNAISPISSTPLYCAIDNFNDPDYAPVFTDNELEHYLVVVADGEDSCSMGCDGEPGGYVTPEALAEITQQLVWNGTKVIVIGFLAPWNAEQLQAIAQNGGTEFTDYLIASDEASLEDAIAIMNRDNVRRLGVIYKGSLEGVISDKDVIRIMPTIIEIVRERSRIRSGDRTSGPSVVGYCDRCDLYSSNLRSVSGEFLCEDCRAEEGQY